MRTLPAGLQAHLDNGATTLCWCWLLTRADGVEMGFTDHDRNLVIGGVTYEAGSGLTGSDIATSVGLSVDNLDASGALSSSRITDADIAGGVYDGASVEIWRVNWSDVSQRLLMMAGTIGEVTRGPVAFSAELRSLAHELGQAKGRTYQYGCDASLGDARCGVDIDGASYTGSGTVTAAPYAYQVSASGLSAFAESWFVGGLVTWTSGLNAGRKMEVKRHTLSSGVATLELWRAMPQMPAVGDEFDVVAGCDKTFATCKAKFGNGVNFRGCPHIPGSEYVVLIAKQENYSQYTGRSMFNG